MFGAQSLEPCLGNGKLVEIAVARLQAELQLLDGGGDPLTGLSAWFTTFVRLEPA